MKSALFSTLLLAASLLGSHVASADPTSAAARLTPQQSRVVLDAWRHEDQDAYGSETFDYAFVRFQCYQFTNLECHLAYELHITKVEDVDVVAHTRVDRTPPYQRLELPLKLAGDAGAPGSAYQGWIASSYRHHRGFYEGHCLLVLAPGEAAPQIIDVGGDDVTEAFRDRVNACLRDGDAQLTKIVLGG